jgi:flagellar biosynthesis GTPase FlhF
MQRQERSDRQGQRLQQRLERRSQQGPLTPSQERNLQTLQAQQGERQRRVRQRQERADQLAQQSQRQLEQGAQVGRLTRSEQRQLRRLQGQQNQRRQRAQMREQMMRQELTPQQGIEARQSRRAMRQARTTPQAAAENRFAGRFHHDHRGRDQWILARREHWAARQAWRHGARAAFIPWYGPVYWPYAYSDIFNYAFWPDAYDNSYWPYAYDDFLDGIFFPYGAPYVGDAYSGPYDAAGVTYPGSHARPKGQVGTQRMPIGRVSTAAQQLCEQPGAGVTAWPIEQMVDTVRPSAEQRALLDDLKNAATRAADAFRNACPTAVPMTPVGRLQAMVGRLLATLDAVHLVGPPLAKFYDSLNDEQKARFTAMGPDVGRQPTQTAQTETQRQTTAIQQADACANAKPGLVDLPIDRIDEVVRPTGDQEDALDRLSDATQKAVDALQATCPTSTPLTPVGRLEVMEQRVNAMLTAAKAIQPALEAFYASLNNEQKARFNALDRDLARED